ncbi:MULTISPECIES: hypothetical protein [unclassified Streptomyces]|uniref:hypothetical protein n=1 Tax=unclassified Streptomyces TaxID=2593676 RepID=UPI0038114567
MDRPTPLLKQWSASASPSSGADEDDARRLVQAEIEDSRGHVDCELGILRVQAVSFGWVVHWGAVGPLSSGQPARPGGNGPFLVDRENERLIRTATSRPVRHQIADYESRLRREAHARNATAQRAAHGERA